MFANSFFIKNFEIFDLKERDYKASDIYLLSIFTLVLLGLSLIPPVWGYDEFASVISHLELDDPRFISLYLKKLEEIGIGGWFGEIIINWLLPIFVVPLRWTYAIGLSPIYSVSRFVDVDWTITRFFLLAFHVIFAIYGLLLIFRSLRFNSIDVSSKVFFTAFILFSFPFLYWTLTLSPYSLHLFCFGVFVYYELGDSSYGLFSNKSLARSLVMLFNYQYIFVVIVYGMVEFSKRGKIFLNRKNLLSWVLPILTFTLSVAFLLTRALLLSKHTNPSQSVVNILGSNSYNVIENSDSFRSFLLFYSSRLFDIVLYFFKQDNYHVLISESYSSLTVFWSASIFILTITLLIYFYRSSSKLLNIVFAFFLTSLIFYCLNIYPMMPSRHSLILFLPFITSITLLFGRLKSPTIKLVFALILFSFAIFKIYKDYRITSTPLSAVELESRLEEFSVKRLIVKPCDLEPIFHKRHFSKYNPLYRCGSEIVERITIEEPTIVAVYAKNQLTVQESIDIISPYLIESVPKKRYSVLFKGDQVGVSGTKFRPDNVSHSIVIIKIE